MLRQSQALIGTAFLCLLIGVFATQGRAQDPRQGARGRGQVALPDGPGKEETQMQCSKCHALTLIVNAGGNTKQEWADLFGTMVISRRAAILSANGGWVLKSEETIILPNMGLTMQSDEVEGEIAVVGAVKRQNHPLYTPFGNNFDCPLGRCHCFGDSAHA